MSTSRVHLLNELGVKDRKIASLKRQLKSLTQSEGTEGEQDNPLFGGLFSRKKKTKEAEGKKSAGAVNHKFWVGVFAPTWTQLIEVKEARSAAAAVRIVKEDMKEEGDDPRDCKFVASKTKEGVYRGFDRFQELKDKARGKK